jgi:branched-chain amino acid transport system ATP-binding protein
MSTGTSRGNDGPEPATQGILVVQDLVKRFGGLTAVDKLSFEVREQEILGFIGPNGSGKSTTFNCITGTYQPTSGTVRYRGEDVTGMPSHKLVHLGVARTFQDFAPLGDRSVCRNIELALAPDDILKLNRSEGRHRSISEKICDRVGLADQMHLMPNELPHAGMLRLELGRAIATDPELILIDEPFAGLSTSEVEEISSLLEDLRSNGMTLVVVDHNMRGLLNLIDRAFVIQFGSKIAEGAPEEITKDPTVRKAYLGTTDV